MNSNNLQQRRRKMFARVLELPARWPAEMSDPQVVAHLDQLREIDQSIVDLDGQRVVSKGRTYRTGQVEALKQGLRTNHLMMLKRAAKLHLKGDDGKPLRLAVPGFKATPAAVVTAALDFDKTLRPRLPELVAKGVKPDVLDRMLAQGQKIYHWRMEVPEERGVRKSFSDRITEHFSQGLEVVDFIRSSLATVMYDNPLFKGAVETATTTVGKPGPPKSPTLTAVQQKKRERRRKRPRRDRPA